MFYAIKLRETHNSNLKVKAFSALLFTKIEMQKRKTLLDKEKFVRLKRHFNKL